MKTVSSVYQIRQTGRTWGRKDTPSVLPKLLALFAVVWAALVFPNVAIGASPTETPTPIATNAPQFSAVTGRIYNDLNNSNTYDEGEGIANVGVSITDASGATWIATTDLRGGFSLSLPAGITTFEVNEATLPSGLVLVNGANPGSIILSSGAPVAISFTYRLQSEITTTPRATTTPIVLATATAAPTITTTKTAPTATPTRAIITGTAPATTRNATNIVDLALASRTGLAASKSVQIGDVIDYTITVKANTKNSAELMVSMPIPDGTEYVAGSATPVDENMEARMPQSLRHTMSWHIRPITSGQAFVAHFSVRVVVGTGSIIAKANAANADTSQSIASNEVVIASRPTAVSLMRFEAVPTTNGIKLIWQTGAELSTFGFAIFRSGSGTTRSGAVLVNANGLISANGGTGVAYEYVDTTAETGQPYSYWLQEVETSGLISEYGPLLASRQAQSAASVIVPSNIEAGGVPVALPSGGVPQNTVAGVASSSNGNSNETLVTQVVQQQVIVPTVDTANIRREQPTVIAQLPQAAAATPEPAQAELPQPVAPSNVAQTEATPTALAPAPEAVANSAAVAPQSEPPTTAIAQQPTQVADQPAALPIHEAPQVQNNVGAVARAETRVTARTDRQSNWMEWVIWALVIFVVWFVVAGILGILVGQYLRHRQ